MQESSSGAEAHYSPGGGLIDKENTSTTGPEVTQDVLGPRGCQGLCQAPALQEPSGPASGLRPDV